MSFEIPAEIKGLFIKGTGLANWIAWVAVAIYFAGFYWGNWPLENLSVIHGSVVYVLVFSISKPFAYGLERLFRRRIERFLARFTEGEEIDHQVAIQRLAGMDIDLQEAFQKTIEAAMFGTDGRAEKLKEKFKEVILEEVKSGESPFLEAVVKYLRGDETLVQELYSEVSALVTEEELEQRLAQQDSHVANIVCSNKHFRAQAAIVTAMTLIKDMKKDDSQFRDMLVDLVARTLEVEGSVAPRNTK